MGYLQVCHINCVFHLFMSTVCLCVFVCGVCVCVCVCVFVCVCVSFSLTVCVCVCVLSIFAQQIHTEMITEDDSSSAVAQNVAVIQSLF